MRITPNHRPILLSLAMLGCAATAAAAGSVLAQLTFTQTGGIVTGISFDAPLVFNTSSAYLSSSVQLRIFDLYQVGTGTEFAGVTTSDFTVADSGGTIPLAIVSPSSRSNMGEGPAYDMMIAYISATGFNFSNGETVILSGSGAATGAMPVPQTGTYLAYLVSSEDGSQLSAPVSLTVNGVPEPSTPLLLGGFGLLAVFGRRRTAHRG